MASSWKSFDEDDHMAALTLYSMQFQSPISHGEKTCFVPREPPKRPERNNQASEVKNPFMIPRLNGLVGRCTESSEKVITKSDVNRTQNRFLFRKESAQLLEPILTATEFRSPVGTRVSVYDSDGKEYKMTFKFWSDKYYVLMSKGWANFVQEHGLEVERDSVRIWAFRNTVANDLSFVMAVIRS